MKDHTGSRFWAEVRLNRVVTSKLEWQYEGILINVQEMKENHQRLVKLAEMDKLTGLYNRRHLDHFVAEDALVEAKTLTMPTSMIVFDLDNFKRVNEV